MYKIVFDANFAGEIKKVELYQPHGSNSGAVWHLNIGRYYHGSIIKRDGYWQRLHDIPNDWFTLAEVQILGDIVEEHLKNMFEQAKNRVF